MKFRHILKVSYAVFLLLLFAHPLWSQDSVQTAKQKKSPPPRLMFQLSDQDVILPISSIEWGTPDRWSITSRYLHGFEKYRGKKTWRNGLNITLSPGISGGRFAVGYQGIYSPRSMPDFAIFSEVRAVLLRTWGNPLSTLPNRTFVGAEFRIGFSWMLNLGIGYYTQISASNSDQEQFYEFHVGIGI